MTEPAPMSDTMAAYMARLRDRTQQYYSPSSKPRSRKPLGMPEADPEQTPDGLLKAIRLAWASGCFPVTLQGPTGTGKSCCAAVVLNRVLEREERKATEEDREPVPPLWWSWPRLCDVLVQCRRDGFAMVEGTVGDKFAMHEADLWRMLRHPRFVVVDEIGTRVANEVRLEAMWQLLEARGRLPTLFTTNLTLQEVPRVFDARVLSRLSAGTWIEVRGQDRRAEGFGSRKKIVGA